MKPSPDERFPAWLAAVVFVVLAGAYLVATPDPTFDLRADRLTALAAVDGADPYAPLSELTVAYDSDLGWTHVHPRTPGALVLQTPLALIPESGMRVVSVVMTAGALLATVLIGLRLEVVRPVVAAVAVVLFGVSSVAVEAVSVGAQSSIVALLLALAWWRTRDGDDPLAGLAAAVAITLKLFPWLLIALLLVRRRTTGLWAIGSAAVLNGLGLLFHGVDVGGAVRAVSSANLSESAELNGSLSRLAGGGMPVEGLTILLAAVGLVLTIGIARTTWGMDRQWFAVLAIGLAASPLIWRHYALVLIPALIWLVLRGGTPGRWVAVLAAVLLFLPFPLITVWLVVPTCIAVAAAAGATRSVGVQQPSNR